MSEVRNTDYIVMGARMIAQALARVQRATEDCTGHHWEHRWERLDLGGTIEECIRCVSILSFGSDHEWTQAEIDAANEVRTPEELAHWDNLGRYPLEHDPFWSDERLVSLGQRMDRHDAQSKALEADITADILAAFCALFPEFVTGA